MHPLDPCTKEELSASVSILRDRGELSDQAVFSCGYAAEPEKNLVLNFKPGSPFDRRVRLIGYDKAKGQSFDAHISLTTKEVQSFEWVENGHSPVNMNDVMDVYEAIFADEAWLEGLRKRGIDDPSQVHVEPWVAGIPHPDFPENARAYRTIAFLNSDPAGNYYARPIEGLIGWVDVNTGQTIVEDHGVVPIPEDPGEYAAARVDKLRDDLKPIEITQPEGPSFEVEGRLVRWQKWQLRVTVHPIEGLILHDVRYNDDGKVRPILHRAGLSDMVVPYGDASPMHYWKHAFDAGETALGHMANSLKLGCDCLGEIHYFDNTLLGPDGEPFDIENAVCMHEEDYGILWKHTNAFREESPPEVRRSRRLVISMIHTVGNYEYGFFWYFYLDGTIQMEIKLTGIVGVSAVADNVGSDTAPLIAQSITSPIHQHLFCFRLDFTIDGIENSVYEVDVEAEPEGRHPYGSGFRTVARALSTEKEAQREIDPSRSRVWRIVNPGKKNKLGQPVGYKLLPQASPTSLCGPDSIPVKRGGFAKHNLWVTPYAEDEMSAGAGAFTNLHTRDDVGLPSYTKANRSVENTDLVVWHTLGVTHVPRPEDWPIMPVEYAGFTLLPVGFFDKNPSVDVPPTNTCKS